MKLNLLSFNLIFLFNFSSLLWSAMIIRSLSKPYHHIMMMYAIVMNDMDLIFDNLLTNQCDCKLFLCR